MLNLAVIIEALAGIRLEIAPEPQPFEERQALGNDAAKILERSISGAVIDSRQAYPGVLFIALPGENVDGHQYLKDAFTRGAWIALVNQAPDFPCAVIDLRSPVDAGQLAGRFRSLDMDQPFCLLVEDSLTGLQSIARFWRAKLSVRIIGVTGSVGKSTTKELTAQVLMQRYRTLKNPGNLNNEIGLPLAILGLTEEHERAVLEMGFFVPGEITFLCEIARPEVGIITNIGTVHASRAGSQEAIARGKAELVQALPPGPQGVAILNSDDPWVRKMAQLTQARVFYYGLSPEADLWADEVVSMGLDGIKFRLHYRKERLHLQAPLIGRHSVHTVLRATAAGMVEGLTWQEIVDGLRSQMMQLRLVTVRTPGGALILDDTYNASPESTLAALNLLDDLDGHKVAVLGDMLELGPYESQGHELVGARAAEVVDVLVTVGERGQMIAQAAWQAGLSSKVITAFLDSQQAIAYLQGNLKKDDVVLVKGSRGMRMEQIVAALETEE
jgi:UDP-N-acetylmuramoyl-tripeptide--D-alanyl-D-alanine ligase